VVITKLTGNRGKFGQTIVEKQTELVTSSFHFC